MPPLTRLDSLWQWFISSSGYFISQLRLLSRCGSPIARFRLCVLACYLAGIKTKKNISNTSLLVMAHSKAGSDFIIPESSTCDGSFSFSSKAFKTAIRSLSEEAISVIRGIHLKSYRHYDGRFFLVSPEQNSGVIQKLAYWIQRFPGYAIRRLSTWTRGPMEKVTMGERPFFGIGIDGGAAKYKPGSKAHHNIN